MGVYASKNVCVKDIISKASMVLQYYQNLKEITSNTFHIVAFVVGFKCPRKIHLNTQCPEGVLKEFWAKLPVCRTYGDGCDLKPTDI